jgi:hypothetical protein
LASISGAIFLVAGMCLLLAESYFTADPRVFKLNLD